MDQVAFGKRLKEALDSRGIPVKRFAGEIGVSYTSASSYTRGERVPTLDGLTRICWRLGVSADWLLGLEGK